MIKDEGVYYSEVDIISFVSLDVPPSQAPCYQAAETAHNMVKDIGTEAVSTDFLKFAKMAETNNLANAERDGHRCFFRYGLR